jgi:hypothetical protein
LVCEAEQTILAVAVALSSTHTVGAPRMDANSTYLGFINEFDAMNMLDRDWI